MILINQLVRRFHEKYSPLFINEEFKREAIKLVTEQHLNVATAGWQLDVVPKSIYSLITEYERGELKATLGAAKRNA